MSTPQIAFATIALAALIAVSVLLIAGATGGNGESSDQAHEVAVPPGIPVGEVVLAASATPRPTPKPSSRPDVDDCGPPIDAEYLAHNQVLSYYGNPYTERMGVLGEMPAQQLAEKLRAHAATYDGLNAASGIRPAFHIVYGWATIDPGREGNHLLYVDDKTMQEYIDLACREGFLVFVDLQIGWSDVTTEVEKVLPYLDSPHVHLAIDPEFAMPAGELPGEAIGTVDAEEINAAQSLVQGYLEARGLGDKMVVVHKFLPEMVTRPELLQTFPNVRLVIDMDGFGPAEVKRVKYGWFTPEAEYAGIKLFFKQDTPLMTETEVLALQPDVIIYQ